MKILDIKTEGESKRVVEILKAGSVIVILPDTIYGLSCLVDDKEAINKIFKIKKRSKGKHPLILVSGLEMLNRYFYLSSQHQEFIKNILSDANLPAITFILRAKKTTLNYLDIDPNKGVAVRLPKNNFLAKIIKSVNKPIISTSCNESGKNPLNSLRGIKNFFKDQDIKPDYIINTSKLGVRAKRSSSRIVDIRDLNNIKILR